MLVFSQVTAQLKLNKTIEDRKSGCGYTCAPRGVDRERCVMVVKTGCVIDGKICMSQRKIMKTVIAPEKKKHVFHYENIAYLDRLIDESQSYDNRTEDKTFDLLV